MAVLGIRSLLVLLLASALGPVATAAPARTVGVGPPELISVNTAGQPDDRGTTFADIDGSGRYVLFDSSATNMAPPGVHYGGEYLRDRRKGTTTIVARNRNGKPPREGSWGGDISPNGRFVAYCSWDPDIVRPDSFQYVQNPVGTWQPDTDVFVRDRRTGETRRLSSKWNGKESDGASCLPQIADNGDTAFVSRASNLVRDDADDLGGLFLYDWSGDRLVRPLPRRKQAGAYALSGDGSLLTVLTVRDPDTAMWEISSLRRGAGMGQGRWEVTSRRADGSRIRARCDPVEIDVSHDGRYVVGSCSDGAMASPAVADKNLHLWLIDRKRRTNTLLNPSTWEDSSVSAVSVSDDGRSVLFGSSTSSFAGTPEDMGSNVYLWRRGAGITLVTPGAEALQWWPPTDVELTADGREGVFISDNLEISDDDAPGPESEAYVVRFGP